jgi:predicted enzyme related to lactoylglutathione lyase
MDRHTRKARTLSFVTGKESIMAKTGTAKRTEKHVEPQAAIWSHGSFYWNELRTRDAERAKRFYESTIGWAFEPMPMDGGATYWVAMLGGKPVAGLFPLTSPQFDDVPESWMSFLAVDDVDKRVAKAIKAGAKLVMPIFDVPNVGRIAMLMEPNGAGIGWMTPVK